MMVFAAVIGALGLAGVLYKRSVLGVLIGAQVLFMGATIALVVGGVQAGAGAQAHLFALLTVCVCVSQGLAAYSVAARVFYLKGRIRMDDLRTLRR